MVKSWVCWRLHAQSPWKASLERFGKIWFHADKEEWVCGVCVRLSPSASLETPCLCREGHSSLWVCLWPWAHLCERVRSTSHVPGHISLPACRWCHECVILSRPKSACLCPHGATYQLVCPPIHGASTWARFHPFCACVPLCVYCGSAPVYLPCPSVSVHRCWPGLCVQELS